MRCYKSVLPFLLLVIFLISCNQRANTIPEKMPDDFNFSVRYGITSKNEINTFESTVTKDLVMNGTMTTNIKLSENERIDIYNKLREINILKEIKLLPKSKCSRMIPFSEDHWNIRIDGKVLSFTWIEGSCEETADARKLEDLREFVFNFVKDKPEYKELPEAVGAYE